jgi:hypothetical protein
MLIEGPADDTDYSKMGVCIRFTNTDESIFEPGDIKEFWSDETRLVLRATSGSTHHFPIRNILEWVVTRKD